jgi:hypothetical protein
MIKINLEQKYYLRSKLYRNYSQFTNNIKN